MGHVAVAGDDLEALDGFGVAYYVVEENGAVFFDPGGLECKPFERIEKGEFGDIPWELVGWVATGVGCLGFVGCGGGLAVGFRLFCRCGWHFGCGVFVGLDLLDFR